MAYGIHSRTVQESVSPYYKAEVSDTSAGNSVSRALVNNGSSTDIDITYIDGNTISLYMLQGVIYPVAAIKTNSTDVVFLY